MNSFERKVLGFPTKPVATAPPADPELHRPTDEQLRNSIQAAREARLGGYGLRFQANDVLAVFEELLELRSAKAVAAIIEDKPIA